MVKVKLFVTPRMYGTAADVVVATTVAVGQNVQLARNIGLALDDDIILLTRVAGATDIPVFDKVNSLQAARSRVLGQLGAAWDVGANDLPMQGVHVWIPRVGWVQQAAGNPQLFLFPLIDGRGTLPGAPPLQYADQHKVKDAGGLDQLLKLDYFVAVQTV